AIFSICIFRDHLAPKYLGWLIVPVLKHFPISRKSIEDTFGSDFTDSFSSIFTHNKKFCHRFCISARLKIAICVNENKTCVLLINDNEIWVPALVCPIMI